MRFCLLLSIVALFCLFNYSVASGNRTVIKIGGISGITDPGSPQGDLKAQGLGIDLLSVMQFAFDEICNGTTILPDHCLELIPGDFGGRESNKAVTETLRLIQEGAKVIIGSDNAAIGRIVATIGSALSVPQLQFVSDDEFSNRQLYDAYFRMQPSNTYIYKGMLRVIKYFGWKRVFFIDSDRSRISSEVFVEAQRLGITSLGYVTMNSGSTDVSGLISLMIASQSKVFVSLIERPSDAGVLLSAAANAGLATSEYTWFGGRPEAGWVQNTPPFVLTDNRDKFDKMITVVFGVTTPTPQKPDIAPEFSAFRAKWWDDFRFNNASQDIQPFNYPNVATNRFAAPAVLSMAYDAAYVVAYAFHQLISDSEDPENVDFTMEEIVEAIRNVEFQGASGLNKFADDGNRVMLLHLNLLEIIPFALNPFVTVPAMFYNTKAEVVFDLEGDSCEFIPIADLTFANGAVFTESMMLLPESDPNRLPVNLPLDFSCENNPCVNGYCSAQDTCTCSIPTYWTGKLCDKRRFVDWSDAVAVVFLVLAALFSFIAILVFLILFANRNTPLVRKSSALFCMLMSIGFLLGYASMLPWIGEPTKVRCMAQIWVPTLAFALVFSNLLAKTWRIDKIFNNSKLQTLHVQNSDLLKFSSGIIFFEVVILLVWSIGARPIPQDSVSSAPDVVYLTCGSENSDFGTVMMAIIFSFNLGLIMYAAVLAYKTRKANYSYRESKHIGYSVYNILFCSIVFIALLLSLENGSTITFVLKQLVTFLMVTFTLAALLLPKVWLVVAHPERNTTEYLDSKDRQNSTPHQTHQSQSNQPSSSKASFSQDKPKSENVELRTVNYKSEQSE